MKSLLLKSNSILKYTDVEIPTIDNDECLISVKHAGICESDITRAYDCGAYFYPLVMGHEISGIVDKVGGDVKDFKKGDKVAVFPLMPCNKCQFCLSQDYIFCNDYDYYGSRRNGGFAEFIAVKSWNLFKLPDDMPLEQAVLLEPVAVAIHAARKMELGGTQNVVILGAGLIGLVIAIYLSERIDAGKIIVFDRNKHKLDMAARFGLCVVNSNGRDWLQSLKKRINNGAEYIIESCGASLTYNLSIELAAVGGNLLWVGNIKDDLTIEKKTVSSILRKELKIQGVWNSRYTHSKDDDWNHALEFIRGCPHFSDIIPHRFLLSDGQAVFEKIHLHKTGQVKDNALPLRAIFDI
ncbi:MAG: galactitol-1-phosphate 5-dehydrogenase [Anaerohalosphaeraceae bacterium]|nr:galactitol-1-phosphate 5-dehydrogenase [Anaerohalosphaeraceae bacterium]